MTTVQHPRVQWVICQEIQPGIFVCQCKVCGAQTDRPVYAAGADQFAMTHSAHQSAAPTHYGAGDLIAKAAGALGIETCTPCEARRRALNAALPRVWRR